MKIGAVNLKQNQTRRKAMTQTIEQVKKPMTVLGFLEAKREEFSKVIPKHMSADRMMRLALSAINTTPHLDECTIQSVAVSLMACSALGLEPNTPLGHAYLIPYNCKTKKNGNWTKEYRCQLIVGYRGYIELFYRSGVVDSAQAFPVFEGDEFEIKMGLHPDLIHVPSKDKYRWDPKRLTHVYAVIRLKDTETPIWAVMDRNQIEQRRARSKAKDDGPWITDYVAMCLKTVIRDIVRWVPFSVDRLAAASETEGAIDAGRADRAILALGPEATEASERLLEGVPEDEPETIEVTEKPTLDTVAAKNREKTADVALEGLRKAVIAEAGKLWGNDEAMTRLAEMCRQCPDGGFSVTACTEAQGKWAFQEVSDRIAARESERD